jgi:hypothetical protein
LINWNKVVEDWSQKVAHTKWTGPWDLEVDGNWLMTSPNSPRLGDLSVSLQYPDRLYWNRRDSARGNGAWHAYFKLDDEDGKMTLYANDDNSVN